jgi:hypothetical protein
MTVNGTVYDSDGFAMWADLGDVFNFTYSDPLVVSAGQRDSLVGVNGTSPLTVTEGRTIMGSYMTQYLVTYSVTGNATTVTVPPDEWVDSGGSAVGVFPTPVTNGGTRCNFVSDNRTTITEPSLIVGTYQTQYYLTVTSDYGTPSGQGWYDSGSTANAVLDIGSIDHLNGTQHVFTNWGTDASGTNYALSNGILVDGPKTATANWKTQYQVSFIITPSGSGSTNPVGTNVWEDEGSLSTSALANPGYIFSNWSSNTGSIIFVDSTFPATTTTISGPGNITATFEVANATLIVRGDNNRIYYRSYNWTTSSWGDWNELPAGTTTDSPATAICGGKQYFIVRGDDHISLWFSWINLTDSSFSGWTWMPGSTPSTPTLITNGTALILVVRGSDNTIYYRVYDVQTQTWDSWHGLLAGTTCDKVGAAILGDTLQLVVRGFSTTDANINNTLWYATMNLTSNTFSGWTFLPGSTPSTPILTAWGSDKLCLVVRGDDDTLYINTYNGTWQGWTGLPSGSTLETPAATVTGDTLIMVVVGMDGNTLWQSSLDLKSSSFSGWIWITGSTPSPPILTS